MIISVKHKFVFVKTRKTAGSTIEKYLSQFLDDKDVWTGLGHDSESPPMNVKGTPLERSDGTGWGHAPITLFQSLPDDYFVFTSERNLLDKTISNYLFFQQYKDYQGSFHDFIQNKNNIPYDVPRYKQRVDFIVRFENLNEDMDKVCERLGFPLFSENNTFHLKPTQGYDKVLETISEEDKEMIRNMEKANG